MMELDQQLNNIDHQISVLLEKKKVLQKKKENNIPNAIDLLMATTKKRKRNIFEDPDLIEAKNLMDKEKNEESSFQCDYKVLENLTPQEKALFNTCKKQKINSYSTDIKSLVGKLAIKYTKQEIQNAKWNLYQQFQKTGG